MGVFVFGTVAVSCAQQRAGAVLSNRGEISEVLVCNLRSDGSLINPNGCELTTAFERRGIAVCSIRDLNLIDVNETGRRPDHTDAISGPGQFGPVGSSPSVNHFIDGDSVSVYIDSDRPWSRVCPDRPIEDCKRLIGSNLSLYAQDLFQVRFPTVLSARRRPHLEPSDMSCLQRFAERLCGGSGNNAIETLPIKGGNYMCADNLVFIGMDELGNFKSCPNWARTIGVDADAERREIETALATNMSAGASDRSVIWIGDRDVDGVEPLNCDKPLKEARHQPIFHIDMFLHPLGRIDKANEKHWYYIIAIPDAVDHDTLAWNELQRSAFHQLRMRLLDTKKRLENDFREMGYLPKPLVVPLLIDFTGSGSRPAYMAFANGLSAIGTGKTTYYMPVYGNASIAYPKVKYDQALERTLHQLNQTGLIVTDTVHGPYTYTSALRCAVKVLSRK